MPKHVDKINTLKGILNGTVPLSSLMPPRYYTAYFRDGVYSLEDKKLTEDQFKAWQDKHVRNCDKLFVIAVQQGNAPIAENTSSNRIVWNEEKSYPDAESQGNENIPTLPTHANELQAEPRAIEARKDGKARKKRKPKESPVMPLEIDSNKVFEPVRITSGLMSQYGITWGTLNEDY